MNRRSFLRSAAGAAMIGQLAIVPTSPSLVAPIHRSDTLPSGMAALLDREITDYMAGMNAPGLGFCLTDLKDHRLVAAYGFEDLETSQPLLPERLFQIGSISKSMAVVLALQLVDEGKLDLHRPVMDYLPWLPWETPFAPVTTHHVFTHTSGLPGDGSLFFPQGGWKHRQRYAPGERYFYSNMAFNAIGHLVEKLDGRTYQQSLKARLFDPLGMSVTQPILGGPEWALQARSYIPAAPDRPYLRFDKLRCAPTFHQETSAGCVASTPLDMAKYLRFLLCGGIAENGKRLLSDASFKKMTHRWIGAEEFGSTAGYGYGIAVDQDGGDLVLLHTGGMVGFMSSVYLNLSQGIGAFASINAQQGYRPTPVTRFATRALRAAQSPASQAAPAHIEIIDDARITGAPEYAGTYHLLAGALLTIEATQTQLHLHLHGKSLTLHGKQDTFFVDDPALGTSSWTFERDTEGKVIGLGHASDFYLKEGEAVSQSSAPRWPALVGDYVNDDPWILSVAVYERNGKLYLDDDVLEPVPALSSDPLDEWSFFIASEKDAPDRAAFACKVDGKMRILILNGTPLRRFHRTTQIDSGLAAGYNWQRSGSSSMVE